MANLAVEVERLNTARAQGDEERTLASRTRAGRIIADLQAHPDMSSRTLEMSRLPDALDGAATPHELSTYFAPFMQRFTLQ